MNEREARIIATELATEIGLPARLGSVLVHVDRDGKFGLLVAADDKWFSGRELPNEFKGLNVTATDKITGEAHFKMKIYA